MIINTYIERYKFLVLSLLFLLTAMLIETNFFSHRFSKHHVGAFEDIVQKKQEKAADFTQKILQLSKQNEFETYRNFYKKHSRFLSNQKMSFFVVSHNKLVFWSDNTITFPIDSVNVLDSPLVFIDNAWYITNQVQNDSITVYFLTFIKNQFEYQNDYIVNKFHSDFNLNSAIQISDVPHPDFYSVYNEQGDFLLALSKNNGRGQHTAQRYFSIVLYFMGIIFLFVFFNLYLRKIRKRFVRDSINILFLVFVAGVRLWMIHNKIPYVCYTTNLFKPDFFAASLYIPSLGDLLIHTIVLIYFVFQVQVRIKDWRPKTKGRTIGFIIISLFFFTLFLAFVAYVMESLVYNSNINLELYHLLHSGFLSFVVYLIIALLLYAYFMLLITFFVAIQPILNTQLVRIIMAITIAIAVLIFVLNLFGSCYWCVVFHVFIVAFFLYIYKKHDFRFNIGIKAFLLLISVLFVQLFLHYHIQKKHEKVKRLYAVNLTNEQDPVAELLLKDVKQAMLIDTSLRNIMSNPLGKDDVINKYLQKKYFSGFLNRYNLESTVCGTLDSFPKSNHLANCEKYFSQLLQEYGVNLSNSDYYFLNNQNGSISYFDSIVFVYPSGVKTKLYIELNSKRISQELGYPKILLGQNVIQSKDIQLYSHAKYKDGKLVSQKGPFPYVLTQSQTKEHGFYSHESYNHHHVEYVLRTKACIIVSHKKPTVFNHVVWFSYIFIYFFLLLTLYDYLDGRKYKGKRFQYTFTEKIRLSLFAVLFVSLILTGVSLVLLNTNQQTKSQQKNVKEKLQSILVEVSQYYEEKKEIPPHEYDFLEALLVRLSNVFFTDINVYNANGDLFASSRPEVFEYHLIGKKMHPKAYYRMAVQQLPEYVSNESIGEMSFTSAYAVLTNQHNQILGYVNVPYFTKQDELTQQITSLIVAILNIYVILLMLATVFAVFISNKITYPLLMLRDKMKLVKIGDKNEKITWQTTDEIGDLIENYNNMIDQLESSVKKLAESEREGAWREMAKQIAHEIKNPLTPIKLNIQLLNKSWEQGDMEFETRLKNISKSIIEQIDALAETANAFSNFAKISEGKPEDLILQSIIENCITLFGQESHVTISSKMPTDAVHVYADKEKMIRLFNNLLKNAIQAIPNNTKGTVHIELSIQNNLACVSVSDTGVGIPLEIQNRMFEPYFTTKNTGSGFGLAICKKIVESAQGIIRFESQQGVGTVFYIELPLLLF